MADVSQWSAAAASGTAFFSTAAADPALGSSNSRWCPVATLSADARRPSVRWLCGVVPTVRLCAAVAVVVCLSVADATDDEPRPPAKPVPAEKSATPPVNSAAPPQPVPAAADDGKLTPLPPPLAKLTETATPLNPAGTVLVDLAGRRVILRTEVACRNCILEMLCVPEGMKEHETILRLRAARAYVVHTGLLALGLDTGRAAQFSPEFVAPSGVEIRIYASWLDADGQLQRRDVREWIRHNVHRYYSAPLAAPPPGLELPYRELRYDPFNHELLWYGPMSPEMRDDLLSKWDDAAYQKLIRQFFQDGQSRPMEASFVFVGSRFYRDPDTGEQFYQAEGGYLICVANFADALLDIREASSASEGAQAYEAWTERIPPEGTPVLLELVPVNLPEAPAARPSATPDSPRPASPPAPAVPRPDNRQ